MSTVKVVVSGDAPAWVMGLIRRDLENELERMSAESGFGYKVNVEGP